MINIYLLLLGCFFKVSFEKRLSSFQDCRFSSEHHKSKCHTIHSNGENKFLKSSASTKKRMSSNCNVLPKEDEHYILEGEEM